MVADVWSLGKLEQIVEAREKLARYDYVFIDEAHRFRNAKTEGYEQLHQICRDKKVILIWSSTLLNIPGIQAQFYSQFIPTNWSKSNQKVKLYMGISLDIFVSKIQ